MGNTRKSRKPLIKRLYKHISQHKKEYKLQELFLIMFKRKSKKAADELREEQEPQTYEERLNAFNKYLDEIPQVLNGNSNQEKKLVDLCRQSFRNALERRDRDIYQTAKVAFNDYLSLIEQKLKYLEESQEILDKRREYLKSEKLLNRKFPDIGESAIRVSKPEIPEKKEHSCNSIFGK